MNNKKEIKENDSQSLALVNTVRVWEQPEDINKIESKKEIEDIADEVITIDDGKVKIKTPRISYITVKNY